MLLPGEEQSSLCVPDAQGLLQFLPSLLHLQEEQSCSINTLGWCSTKLTHSSQLGKGELHLGPRCHHHLPLAPCAPRSASTERDPAWGRSPWSRSIGTRLPAPTAGSRTRLCAPPRDSQRHQSLSGSTKAQQLSECKSSGCAEQTHPLPFPHTHLSALRSASYA